MKPTLTKKEVFEKDDKPSILAAGNSLMSNTGFSSVMRNILPRLTDKFRVFAMGFEHMTAPLKYKGVMCLPTGRNAAMWGADVIPQYLELIKPDYFITFTDLHQLTVFPVVENWIKCVTIDAVPVHRDFFDLLRQGYLNVLPNKFGADELVDKQLPVEFIPYGVDNTIFKPEKSEMFKYLEGKFIFGSVGKNIERKRWDRLLRAFKIVAKECKDAALVCYSDPRDDFDYAIDAQSLASNLGIAEKVFFPKDILLQRSILTDEEMAYVFNGFDVHVTTAEREGFGLPILESMACGKPNVVVDYSAPPEIVDKTGIKVKVSDWNCHSSFNYKGALVSIPDFADAMITLYQDDKLRRRLGRLAHKRAVEKYDWSRNVVPVWKELLTTAWTQEI